MADERDHTNDIQLATLDKDGDKLIHVLEQGHMAAIYSENELMYVFPDSDRYLCYIHTLDAEEGRARAYPKDEAHRAVIKHLADLADLLFEVEYKPDMERLGVMFSAEQGIIRYLDVTGQLPVEDVDFMEVYEHKDDDNQNETDDLTDTAEPINNKKEI